MALLRDLPRELVEKILGELPRRERGRMGLTCKFFNEIAIPKLYEHCSMKYCEYADTFLVYPVYPVTTMKAPDYVTFAKYGSTVKCLEVGYDARIEGSIYQLRFLGDTSILACINTLMRLFSQEIVEKFRIMDRIPRIGNGQPRYLEGITATPEEMIDITMLAQLHEMENIPLSQISFSNQLHFLAPKFRNLRTLRMGSGGQPSLKHQIDTLHTVLVNCLSLKDVSIAFIYSGPEQVKSMKTLVESGKYRIDGTRPYANLESLCIELTEQSHKEGLVPAHYLMGLLRDVLSKPIETVKQLNFQFKLATIEMTDERQIPSSWCPRNAEKYLLVFPNLEVIKIILTRHGTVFCSMGGIYMSRRMFLEYIRVNTTRVKWVTLANLGYASSMKKSVTQLLQFVLAKFPAVETLQFTFPEDDEWIEGISSGVLRELESIREIRVQPGAIFPRDSSLTRFKEMYTSKCNFNVLKRPVEPLPFEIEMMKLTMLMNRPPPTKP
ncbi:hypothetical protein TWF730_006618 [Orbilia blumenaviensis]|uniref:F-box domain-containing protein n=1 Tax=Orbilia blumenaviensis TaxID=1796055 RepID=A0AAV9VH53_9PEZI